MSHHSAYAKDELAYIPIPKANQIADLNDLDQDGVINARDLCTLQKVAITCFAFSPRHCVNRGLSWDDMTNFEWLYWPEVGI